LINLVQQDETAMQLSALMQQMQIYVPSLSVQYVNVASDVKHSVTHITSDSRSVRPGSLFVALTGEHADGHQYLTQALQAGATVLVVSNPAGLESVNPNQAAVLLIDDTQLALAWLSALFHGLPGQHLRLIGVTGTNGKTTVTHLIEQMLLQTGRNVGLIGTLGNKTSHTADQQSAVAYVSSGHTTPMAPDLQATLAGMRHHGVQDVVMEVSSHALAQHRVAGCQFQLAVLTNLTQDHLDFHKTMTHYAASKARLFEGLTPGHGAAVINVDDKWSDTFVKACPAGVAQWTYAIRADHARVRAQNLTFTVRGASFDVLVDGQTTYPVALKLAGEFSVYNALAALTAGLALGLHPPQCIQAVESVQGVPGRFEVVAEQPYVIVDYAHTPDGLDNVLKAARQVTPAHASLIAVFGCGGDRDATKRPKMGHIAETLADKLVITSDNPRSEDPQQILTDILAGIQQFDSARMKVQPDREKAIYEAMDWSEHADDVIVVAGKGHENYQILADRTIHFDDKEMVQAYRQHQVSV
jgi:UDP-N-acetylmuramoyl-L-alanyl-D-glutamate--2,6-diaminopimelate ligase